MKRSHPFVILMQQAENSFCRHSDKVVSLLCAADGYLQRHGMSPDKFWVVMNGVVLEEWNNPSPLPDKHRRILEDFRQKEYFIICYFGSLHSQYAVDYLIRAYQMVRDEKVAVVIVGEGYQKEYLQKITPENCNVCYLPKIPKKAVPSLLGEVDCCYVGALNNDMFRFGICMNKLFDSMMSGKPLLYAVNAPNNPVSEFDCGISVPAEDVDALAEGIRNMIQMSLMRRRQMGINGKKAILENYTYEKLAEKFAMLFELRDEYVNGREK